MEEGRRAWEALAGKEEGRWRAGPQARGDAPLAMARRAITRGSPGHGAAEGHGWRGLFVMHVDLFFSFFK
jgi:hypothetical protein